jgi:two-component system chemotaxis response regulator CheB
MGAAFMEGFASWLNAQTDLDVALARPGILPEPGHVYVAPGDKHLALSPGATLRLAADPPLGNQRPSANVLFHSLAGVAGAKAMGILMTGMGEDGARGLAELRQAGGYTITEDESTCVVYGMPAAAVKLGASRVQLPLDAIAPHLLHLVGTGTR